jgi:hypothetical protein
MAKRGESCKSREQCNENAKPRIARLAGLLGRLACGI